MSESNNSRRASPTEPLDQSITHRYDWDETDPSLAVVETVAVAANHEPTDGKPLYDAVDPESLDQLVRSRDGRRTATVDVSFTYEGFDVTVSGDGTVTVEPVDGLTF